MKALLVFALALFSAEVMAAETFPIGVWYEGGVGEFRNNLIPEDPAKAAAMYKRDFADMKAHGVNAAVVPNTQPNHHKVLLDAAQASKVQLIIELDRGGGELGQMVRGETPLTDDAVRKTLDAKLRPVMNHPALWGVQLLDEPPAPSFERYSQVMDALKSYAPRLQPFSCLIGSGAIESFLNTAKQGVVAFDAYPLGPGTPVGDSKPMLGYDQGAQQAAQAASKTDTPVWAVIQAHSWGDGLRVPTPAELRCMTYLALANGCKGIWWFLYQTECDAKGNVEMQGLVDKEFKETALWREAGQLAKEIKKLSPVLLDLTPTEGKLTSNGVAHLLKDSKGELYVAVVNPNTSTKLEISVRVTDMPPGHKTWVKRLRVGKIHLTAHDPASGTVSWTDTLAPGDGAFYAIKPI